MNQFLSRSLLLVFTGAPLMTIYLWINHRENVEHRVVAMPDWVPFWPLMTIPYLLMLIAPWFAAYQLKEQRNFYRYLTTVLLSFLVIGLAWYSLPTEMPRPETPEGIQYEIHRSLVAVDNPVCIAPCGHVMGPIAVIYLLVLEKRRRLTYLVPLLTLGLISIATTWQHRPIDILVGSLITLGMAILSGRLIPQRSQGSCP